MFKKLNVMLLPFAVGPLMSQASESNWTDKVDLGADFRFRHEMTKNDSDDARHRQRIRARFSMSGEVDDNVKLYLRLATGEADASAGENFEEKTRTSGNQTLNDAGENKPFWLDKAFAQWTPNDLHTVMLGKFGTPFYRPEKSQLIWDSDWTPEGFAYQLKCQCGEGSLGYYANLMAAWIDENGVSGGDDGTDQGLFGAQIGMSVPLGEPSLKFMLGSYTFSGIEGHPAFDDGNGNTLNSADEYANEYIVNEAMLELSSMIGSYPTVFFIDYIQNSEVDEENKGYLVGLYLGKIKQVGDWKFAYNYRELEKDATLGALSDSDFSGGDTDAKGHMLAASYGIFKNSNVTLAYFDVKKNISSTETDYKRAHLDFSFKF